MTAGISVTLPGTSALSDGPSTVRRFGIPLPGDRQVPAVQVDGAAELSRSLAALGLPRPRPVLVLVGGAANLDPSVAAPLLRLFEDLAAVLDRAGAALIDGATAYGVMELAGQARRATGARFPLVGVAAIGTVEVPGLAAGGPCGSATLDPHHSHFVLVPGARWGDESHWISACARVLAGGLPSLTLVAAGGEVTRLDVAHSLDAQRPLLVIGASGGTADQLARWRGGGEPPPGMRLGPAELGLIEVLDLADPGAVVDRVSRYLGSRDGRSHALR